MKKNKIIVAITGASGAIYAKVLLDKKSPFLKSVVINKGTKTNLKKTSHSKPFRETHLNCSIESI